jgi:hypothetical protein
MANPRLLVLRVDLKADNIMYNLPGATTEANIRTLLEVSPSRRHPPEQSWDYTVEAAVSQPLPPPSIDQALSASFLIADFGSGGFNILCIECFLHNSLTIGGASPAR